MGEDGVAVVVQPDAVGPEAGVPRDALCATARSVARCPARISCEGSVFVAEPEEVLVAGDVEHVDAVDAIGGDPAHRGFGHRDLGDDVEALGLEHREARHLSCDAVVLDDEVAVAEDEDRVVSAVHRQAAFGEHLELW